MILSAARASYDVEMDLWRKTLGLVAIGYGYVIVGLFVLLNLYAIWYVFLK